MRLVPVLFPCDLGSTVRGRYETKPERGTPDLVLDMLEGEGVRMARPKLVPVAEGPSDPDPEDAPLKLDSHAAAAVKALAEVVDQVNAEGNFPVILGGDHLGLCGHVLGHSVRHAAGVGLAVLADAHLDLAMPGTPAYDDKMMLRKDATATWDGDADRMVLAGALGMLPADTELGAAMAASPVQREHTSVIAVRGPESAQVRANERKAKIEVWRMERLELDGESSYRTVLSRHLEAGPIALSIDASGLDPHLMTAVRRQVSDGIDWRFLKRSLEQCAPHVDRLLGLDICGIDPSLDDVQHSAMQRLVESLAPFLRKLGR